MKLTRSIVAVAACGLMAGAPGRGLAQTWTTWTSVTPGSANGTLFGQAVTFSGGNVGGNTSNAGTDYFQPSAPYTQNGLTSPNSGGNVGFLRFIEPTSGAFTFAAPMFDLFLAFVSVGQHGLGVTYSFNHPFVVRTDNTAQCAYWGCGTFVVNGNSITGFEYSGTIEFLGPIDDLKFEALNSEDWHGLTIGAESLAPPPVTASPEPNVFALLAIGLLGLGVFVHSLNVGRRRRS